MGKCISILGSTGSIGTQSLEVAKAHDMQVHALAANRNITLLEQQTREYHPKKVCIFEESQYQELKQRLADLPVQVLCGMDGLCDIAADKNADILINSVVGMVGLLPTLTAISAGMDVALANKETLVAGGSLVMEQAARKGVHIYPVDSEHSAIFQCLQGNRREQLNKIILTASGGPFFGKTRAELENVTVADALNHPNWSMGNKITIDSATLMNKGLEFIEAKWLFDRDRGTSSERCAFGGRIPGLFRHRSAGRTGYENSDSVRPAVSGENALPDKASVSDRLRHADIRETGYGNLYLSENRNCGDHRRRYSTLHRKRGK